MQDVGAREGKDDRVFSIQFSRYASMLFGPYLSLRLLFYLLLNRLRKQWYKIQGSNPTTPHLVSSLVPFPLHQSLDDLGP